MQSRTSGTLKGLQWSPSNLANSDHLARSSPCCYTNTVVTPGCSKHGSSLSTHLPGLSCISLGGWIGCRLKAVFMLMKQRMFYSSVCLTQRSRKLKQFLRRASVSNEHLPNNLNILMETVISHLSHFSPHSVHAEHKINRIYISAITKVGGGVRKKS